MYITSEGYIYSSLNSVNNIVAQLRASSLQFLHTGLL